MSYTRRKKSHRNISRFMQDIEGKKGALRAQLRIPKSKTIPCTFLQKIRKTELGKTIKNPTQIGVDEIKVTPLLKKRAVLALTYKRVRGGCA
jgi:hypothetical protein